MEHLGEISKEFVLRQAQKYPVYKKTRKEG